MDSSSFIESLKFDANRLITCVTQDASNGQVLMVAYMNREAVIQTLTTGRATYWSRSRQKFWIKGESSGHFQQVVGMFVDCDQDCLLLKVNQTGPACHNGYRSCFYRQLDHEEGLKVIAAQEKSPEEIYKKS